LNLIKAFLLSYPFSAHNEKKSAQVDFFFTKNNIITAIAGRAIEK
jgi:hypothetical protein